MADPAIPKRRGRPELAIDPKQVEQLAKIGCTQAEIAAVLGCSQPLISTKFADTIKKGHELLRKSLRRKQYEVAMKGDRTMLIWLGKQWLGQTDKREDKIGGDKELIKVLKGVDWEKL